MLKIEKYDDLGQGIGRIDNKICFVKRAIPEEIVDIHILKEKKNYLEAEITKIISKSEKRVNPVCQFYDKCGGCNFLHTTSLEEKMFKIARANRFFSKMDYFYDTEDFYRNKIVLHVYKGKLGFFLEKTNDLVEIDFCYLVNPKINEVIRFLKKTVDSSYTGKIVIRNNSLNETMVIIDSAYKNFEALKQSLLIDNLIIENMIVKGKNYFIEHFQNYKFMIHDKSFFQVNRLGLEKVSLILENFLKDKKLDTILDLYSGTSVLGILVSKYCKKVISIEANKSATDDAKENLKLNHITNLKVINGLVEDYIEKFKNIDLVIVDPARRGLDLKTIKYLNKIKSSYIIYIACGIDSLRRDLEYFKNSYLIDKLYLVDMFKRTRDVETVAILKIKV